MKFVLILMITNHGGSFLHQEFEDKVACENALKIMLTKEGGSKLEGDCFPLSSLNL